MNKKSVALIGGIILAVLILMIVHPGKPSDQVFPKFYSDPLKITPGSVNDEDPSLIQAQDGTLYVAWFSEESGGADIWMTHSEEPPIWSRPQPVITSLTKDYYPTLIQAGDGTFHLSWFGIDPDTGDAGIFYSNSQDAITWSLPVKIAPDPALDWVPSLMQDRAGVLRIVWTSDRTGNKEIFMVSSDDGGHIWTDPQQVTTAASADDYPFLAQRDDGTYLLAWTRYILRGESLHMTNPTAEIVLSTSVDTLNWSHPLVISSPDPEQKVTDVYPVIFRHNKKYFISWTSDREDIFGDIVAQSLMDDTKITLTRSEKADYTGRIISLNDTTLAMVWVSNREGNNAIFFQEFYGGTP